MEYTGIEKCFPLERFASYLSQLASGVDAIYTSFNPEELMRETSLEKLMVLERNLTFNPWDGRLTREK
ncbi:MAG: hypothetical protein WBK32_02170 [Candidatus Saccharicenans sp.]